MRKYIQWTTVLPMKQSHEQSFSKSSDAGETGAFTIPEYTK